MPYVPHTPEDIKAMLEVIGAESVDDLFAHLPEQVRLDRPLDLPDGLSEEEVRNEGKRCMSCGMCFECNNCVVFCPQDAVFQVKKNEQAVGRFVDTDYTRCIGCHICKDVCPTGYIQMGLGE